MAEPERLTSPPAMRSAGAHGPARAPVWVLDDAAGGGPVQALGIAERIGLPFRRVPLHWRWLAPMAGLAPGGSLLGLADRTSPRRLAPPPGAFRPSLVLSAGSRAAPVSLWIKTALGCQAVHCVEPGAVGWLGGILPRRAGAAAHDLFVVPEEYAHAERRADVIPVLAPPHRVGPPALRQAHEQWSERLDHLPRPRVVLLVGGPAFGTEMEPSRAHVLGRSVARLAGGVGGSVLASTSRRTGREAGEALAAGLGQVMHLIHRWDEPGENPYLGFLAMADAVVVTADSGGLVAEACAADAPVFLACPELAGLRERRLLRRLVAAGQVRPLRGSLSPWPRTPLDEAGRVAAEIRRRLGLTTGKP